MIGIARQNLQAAKEKIRFLNDGDLLFGCVKTQIVPGHTPGHTLSHILADDEELIHMGDISHDAALLLTHPEWGVAFDTDFEAAAKARRQILADLTQSRKKIFSFHLPWPGLGHIRKKEDAFEWVAQAFSTPQIDEIGK
jgi:glyoxylase-like metal-dependent hydrolase (beta-lactamase superfamily II)